MSAGLPGLGLGGLFFILSALLAPFVELVRTVRGRSSVAAWRAVGRQFALAMAMVAALELTLRLVYALADTTGLGGAGPRGSLTVLPLLPIAITLALLATVLGAAKAMELGARLRSRERLPVPAPGALLSPIQRFAGLGALAAVWFALLLLSASDLSPGSAGKAGGEDRPESAPALAALAPAKAGGAEAAARADRGEGARPRGWRGGRKGDSRRCGLLHPIVQLRRPRR